MSRMQHLSSGALTATLILAVISACPLAAQQPVWTKPNPASTPDSTPATPPPAASSPTSAPAPQTYDQPAAGKYRKPIPGKKNKLEYIGPKDVVELAPTPMLDQEGRQRLDPEGKPMFNPPVRQQRDKHGNPLFNEQGRPVMQTASDLGYDEKGKKIHGKKEKHEKAVSVAIERGTLTVDGMTGKAGLNYDIKDLRYIYLYAPWIGITIVSQTKFAGSIEQKNAFKDNNLTVTVEDHTLQLSSDKRLLSKKPESAFVAVDRDFKLPSSFPVMGYGETLKPPYAWPGSRENVALKGAVAPPPLPPSIRPVTLLQPCPPGQMRMPGKTPLPGENVPSQPCVVIPRTLASTGASSIPVPASTNSSTLPGTQQR